MAAVVDAGELFVQYTYILEGDGFLAPFTYLAINHLKEFVGAFGQVENHPRIHEVASKLGGVRYQNFRVHAINCINSGFRYFMQVACFCHCGFE